MKWVNSRGGPLICAEERISVYWMGAYGLSAIGGSTQRNDYERACSTCEYLGTMACAGGHVLALGDEPLQSSFFRTLSGNLAIARWVYAQSPDDVEKFLKGPVGDASELTSAVSFEVGEGPLVLFDSALRGADASARCTKADVQPGSYQVTTEKCQLEKTFSFIVHRFLKAGDQKRSPSSKAVY